MVKRRILVAAMGGVLSCLLLRFVIVNVMVALEDYPEQQRLLPSRLKGKKLPFHQVYEPRQVGFPADLSLAESESEDTKTILLWTPWNGLRHTINYYFLQEGDKSFSNCPNRKCIATHDRKRLSEAHAILFHLIDTKASDWPRYRNPKQAWILYNMEAPWQIRLRVYPELLKFKNVFNWTMGYREDSDIVARYGFISKSRDINATPLQLNKTKGVAWFVSDCSTDSRREEYVKELQRYIDVDVYGTCGTHTCFPSQSSVCYEEVLSRYRFYLSFENALCRDYVTEKFFNAYNYDVVPVVFGRANYSTIAPPGTFVDATRFQSPKMLAAHLLNLSRDEAAYQGILRKKRGYRAYLDPWACRLCEKLHSTAGRQSTLLKDVEKWWLGDKCSTWNKTEQRFVYVA